MNHHYGLAVLSSLVANQFFAGLTAVQLYIISGDLLADNDIRTDVSSFTPCYVFSAHSWLY